MCEGQVDSVDWHFSLPSDHRSVFVMETLEEEATGTAQRELRQQEEAKEWNHW